MPFVGAAFLEDFALMIENDALDLRLNVETIRHARQAIDNRPQAFSR